MSHGVSNMWVFMKMLSMVDFNVKKDAIDRELHAMGRI